MDGLRARVRDGYLTLHEPTSLPEGSEVVLGVVDGGDDLDDAERARLEAVLQESWSSACAGDTVAVEDVLKDLEAIESRE